MVESTIPTSRIGLVTVTFSSGAVIDDFMQSVLAQTFQDFILYIVDNASSDDTLLRVAAFPDSRVRVIESGGNVGVAAGNNTGIHAALADGCTHVLLVNNDTVFDPNLLSEMLKAMSTLNTKMLVPKITFFEPRSKIWCAGGGFNRLRAWATVHYGEGEIDNGQFEKSRAIEYSPTCCMLISADVFQIVGYMDERYFVYSDDADYCFRCKKQGIQLWYSPAATLAHKVSSLTGGGTSAFTIRYATRNRVFFIRKNLPKLSIGLWLFLYQIYLHLNFLRRKDTWPTYKLKQRAFREGFALS